jgi:hypothetical protein
MPKAALNHKARHKRSQIAIAVREDRPAGEIQALQLEYRAAVAESLIETGKRELAEVEALVAKTRAEQGLPPHVTDPLTLAKAADILRLPSTPDDRGAA